MTNKVYYGDNLKIMQSMGSNTVDLIITDPPFCSQRDYGQFDDNWESLDSFLDFMRPRLQQMFRLLKDSGSLYLHCDQSASHYLKVELDSIFGMNNFRNQIIWKRSHGNKVSKRSLANNSDHILHYTIGNNFVWNPDQAYLTPDQDFIDKFNQNDNDGRGPYYLNSFTQPKKMRTKTSESWRRYEVLGCEDIWYKDKETADQMISEGSLVRRGNSVYMKYYLSENKGMQMDNIWSDIFNVTRFSSEYTGYPTQKPMALIQRIILLSSNNNDLILDPFAGSGTTLDAAQSLSRSWIGIDKNDKSIEMIESRIHNGYGLFANFTIIR